MCIEKSHVGFPRLHGDVQCPGHVGAGPRSDEREDSRTAFADDFGRAFPAIRAAQHAGIPSACAAAFALVATGCISWQRHQGSARAGRASAKTASQALKNRNVINARRMRGLVPLH